jgi:hypothetical protein
MLTTDGKWDSGKDFMMAATLSKSPTQRFVNRVQDEGYPCEQPPGGSRER